MMYSPVNRKLCLVLKIITPWDVLGNIFLKLPQYITRAKEEILEQERICLEASEA
jgi:hypothetical protein